MKRNDGFTLAELLVVVAIISVLVAISIPVFVKETEKAREAVDISNMRNAYSLMSMAIIDDETIDGKKASSYSVDHPLYFDGSSLTSVKPKAYGRGTESDGGTMYSPCNDYEYVATNDYRNAVIIMYYEIPSNKIHVHWDSVKSNNNTGDNTNSSNTITIDNKIINTTLLPDSIEASNTFSVYSGNVYNYKNKYYVALASVSFNEYYYDNPAKASWLYLELTNNIIDSSNASSNGTISISLKAGDIYSDENTLYIRKTDANANQSQIPSLDSQNWQIINF